RLRLGLPLGLRPRPALPGPGLASHPQPATLGSAGTMDVAVGLTSCFLCFLLPSGWVLSHLESYKKQE
uniref:Cytochrome c oxidase subunit 8 n=1 Tax=Canis lupus dingo TaxID=286419 RepID=A0A8C0LDL6_CANLU